ncbi:MAG: hypothetical protein KDD44_01975 [Bdellovibrionales bacterium]|nr:hypothetical protein [Bdellovibrionales bacterium]
MSTQSLTTDNKALEINLDRSIYGTIAEIGAGQDVARRFFAVGAASGTVAKSMSAYDMTFSDEIYGPTKRYVSRERLLSMLDHEFSLLVERLGEQRGETSRFFAFADTVAARNYGGTNECHGWMGVRFQLEPRAEPQEIILHVRMLDPANILQQEALGIFGMNLLYGAFHLHHDPERLVASLADDLGTDRIEVEALELRGSAFEHVSQRELNLALLEKHFNNAVLIGPDRKVRLASEELYKRPVVLLRGSFRPITLTNLDMLRAGREQFVADAKLEDDEPVIILEMTIRNLLAHNISGRKTLLQLVDSLTAIGYHVLISDYREYFRLSSYLRRYTNRPIAILIGTNNLVHLFNESFYRDLPGGILEAFGRLFRERIRLFVYPMGRAAFESYFRELGIDPTALERSDDDIITVENMKVSSDHQALFRYLTEANLIRPIHNYRRDYLKLHSSEVRSRIQAGDERWREAVPEEAARVISETGLFLNDDE